MPASTQSPQLRLARRFYRRDPVTLARALLGQLLVRVISGQRQSGVIVETEAYLGIADKAAHTYNRRRTARNESMWKDGGHCYVYFTYGMHHCLNVVAGRREEPVAILIRAIEPAEGIHVMYTRRDRVKRATDLCSGPAKLTKALSVDRNLDGIDLTSNNVLFIERRRKRCLPQNRIVVSSRIGVGYAEEWAVKPLRFYTRDSRFVSRL